MVYIPSITTALAVGVLPQLYDPHMPIYLRFHSETDVKSSVSAAGLHTAAVAKGLTYFGTATDNPELTDTAYVTQLNNTGDFGQVTPGNSMKVRLHHIFVFCFGTERVLWK